MMDAKIDSPFAWATAQKSVHGRQNEDVLFTLKVNGGVAAAVLDGMGGAPDGGKASQMAASILFHNLNMMDFRHSPDEVAANLRLFLQLADRHLKQTAQTGRLDKSAGTTAVIAVVLQTENSNALDIVIGWGGDSRAYLYQANGQFDCLTIDNESGVEFRSLPMIRSRMAQTQQPFLSKVTAQGQIDTPQKSRAFAQRNIIDIGLFSDEEIPTPQYPVSIVRASLGSRIILCSDGLSDPLTDLEIKDLLDASQPFEGALALVHAAKARPAGTHLRGKDDDVTVVEIAVAHPSGGHE